jgi:hypothetical protein
MEFSAPFLKSIEQLQYQTTPGELATQSGLPLATVERDLQQLAIAVGGHLQVSTSGEIIYKYPADIQGILRKKFLWLQVKSWLETAWKILFYIIRISFGLLLLASFAIIALSLLLITLATMFSNDGDGVDLGGIGDVGDVGFGDWGSIWIFDWGSGSNYAEPVSPEEVKELSFLGAVFSVLFGDGNPNAKLEELRWRSIGQTIRKNRGVVTAEQVAPYLDNVSPHSEDHILPVLLRFNGQPEVSPIGDIVYRFPDVQAISQKQKFKRLSSYLEEKNWQFSAATHSQRWQIGLLAAFNCSGALALGWILKGMSTVGGLLGFAASIYWILLIYAVGFVAIPIGRLIWLQWVNNKISTRNNQRRRQVALLNSEDVDRKLLFANEFRSEQLISAEDIAYRTDEDLLEQEFNNLLDSDDAPQLPPEH